MIMMNNVVIHSSLWKVKHNKSLSKKFAYMANQTQCCNQLIYVEGEKVILKEKLRGTE